MLFSTGLLFALLMSFSSWELGSTTPPRRLRIQIRSLPKNQQETLTKAPYRFVDSGVVEKAKAVAEL
jgi:hypothetical protein